MLTVTWFVGSKNCSNLPFQHYRTVKMETERTSET